MQWLFIIEGVPSVLLGAAMMLLLPSGPLTAWMLTPKERQFLHNKVRRSQLAMCCSYSCYSSQEPRMEAASATAAIF
jgi:hypothetical protein